MRIFNIAATLSTSIMLLIGCQPQETRAITTYPKDSTSISTPDTSTANKVLTDTQFSSLIFPAGKDILTGGDGAISIAIDENKSYWLWGDSFLGEVKNGARATSTPLIMGNVWLLLDGNKATTIHGGTTAQPKSLLEFGTVDGHPTMLWPMHGFVKNNIVHVFMSVIPKTGSGTFDFYWHSARYYRLNYPDLSVIDSTEMEAARISGAHFGFAFVEHNGYYYTYGTSPKSDYTAPIHVARAKLVNDKLQGWEFFDGNNWVSDYTKTKALTGVDIPISEQFSVFKHGDKFILLSRDRFHPHIYTYIADKPEGPWRNKKKVYTEPEASNSKLMTYNAMAHPQYDKNDRLLVSYCVNANNLADLFNDVSTYRPRFIWVPYTLILQE